MQSAIQQRAEFERRLTEVLEAVRARRFRTYKDLAQHFGKDKSLPVFWKKTLVQRGRITLTDWEAAFIGRREKKPSWKCPHCGERFTKPKAG